MIPKNKRRTVFVNAIEYEYCISGKRDDTGRTVDLSVFIKNTLSKKTFSKYYETYDGAFTPMDVGKLIIENKI